MSCTASAHHSRANYALQEFVELEATVVEFSWKNPHVFAVVEVSGAGGESERLLLEMNSKPILSGMGWTDKSLGVGDAIRVRGNPDRRGRKQLFVAYVITSKGDKLWSFGRPASEARRQAGRSKSRSRVVAGSTDFSGVWARARLPAGHPSKKNPFGPSTLPVTAAGRAALQSFDPNDDPSFDCEPKTLPTTIVPVYPLKITIESDVLVTFEYELNNGFREIHLGATELPAGSEPTLMGYSQGRYEEGALVVETRNFTPNRWGNGRGLPSSVEKVVTERYTLVENGKRLLVRYTLRDPVYVNGIVEEEGAFVLRPSDEFPDFECDRNAAVRHLTGQ